MDRELRWDLIWLIRLLQYRIAKLLQEYNLDFARLTVGQRRVWFIVYDHYLNILLDRWDSTSFFFFFFFLPKYVPPADTAQVL